MGVPEAQLSVHVGASLGYRGAEALTAVAEGAPQCRKLRWFEAEVQRIAGEIALKSPESDAAKAETHFERALAVARKQQANSWELRATMSMARHWRDQGKRDEAGDLLAPIYGWFTEGFDTLDLKEAKALLHERMARGRPDLYDVALQKLSVMIQMRAALFV